MNYQTHLDQALTLLEQARHKLNGEISSYPTPISGCDVQFNHLLSERQKMSEALTSLRSQPFVPTPRIPNEGWAVESR